MKKYFLSGSLVWQIVQKQPFSNSIKVETKLQYRLQLCKVCLLTDVGESYCICEAFCDSRGSLAKPEIMPQMMLANPEEEDKTENERTARANQTSAAHTLRLAALATFSITNLHLKLTCQGLSCIVGNVGIISLHKRRMNGTSIFVASILIFLRLYIVTQC